MTLHTFFMQCYAWPGPAIENGEVERETKAVGWVGASMVTMTPEAASKASNELSVT